MYRELRRKDRATTQEEARKILREQQVGVLSTVDQEGQPYGVPLNYIFEDGAIYFHCALEGHKLVNIEKNPRVCFVVYGSEEVIPEKFSTRYESAVAFGRAHKVEGEEKFRALKGLIEKYASDFMKEGLDYIDRDQDQTAVVKIVIEHLTGKRAYLPK